MIRNCVIALIVCAGLISGCSRGQSDAGDGVLALVDGTEITLDDFRREYVSHLTGAGLADDLRRRYAFLNRMVGMKLLVQESRHNGLADTDEYHLQEQVISNKLLVDLLIQRALLDTMQTTSADLEEMLVRVNTQLSARHLYARTKTEAMMLHGRLMNGESFEDLAREVFNDERLAESGGSLGYISFDEMDPAFEDAAFRLEVGEISDPVRTAQGYSIIQVEDRFVKPLLTETDFATKRDQLEAYVRTRKEQAARRGFLQRVMVDTAPDVNEDVLDEVFGFISGQRIADSDDPAEALMDRVLVSFQEQGRPQAWTVREFQMQAALASSEQRAAVQTTDDLKAFVHGLTARNEMVRRASEEGLDTDPAFDRAYAYAMESWLYDRAFNTAVAEIEVEPDTVKHYYNLYADEFMTPERVRVGEILVASEEEASSALRALEAESFENVARDYSIRPGARETGGDLGLIEKEQLGVFAERVFSAEAGDTIGPVELDGMYVLLRVGERDPARRAPFEEIRSNIEEIIRQTRKQAALRQRIESLKGVYTISLSPEGIDTLNLTAHVSS